MTLIQAEPIARINASQANLETTRSNQTNRAPLAWLAWSVVAVTTAVSS